MPDVTVPKLVNSLAPHVGAPKEQQGTHAFGRCAAVQLRQPDVDDLDCLQEHGRWKSAKVASHYANSSSTHEKDAGVVLASALAEAVAVELEEGQGCV